MISEDEIGLAGPRQPAAGIETYIVKKFEHSTGETASSGLHVDIGHRSILMDTPPLPREANLQLSDSSHLSQQEIDRLFPQAGEKLNYIEKYMENLTKMEEGQRLDAEAGTQEDSKSVDWKVEEVSDSPDAGDEDRRALVRECPGCNEDLFRSACYEEGDLSIHCTCTQCEEIFCDINTSEQRALLWQKFGVPCGKDIVKKFDQIAEGDLLEMEDPDSFLQLFASHALCVSKNDSAETFRIVAFRQTSLFLGKVTEEEVSLSYLLERRCSVFRFLPLDCLPVTSSIAKARDSCGEERILPLPIHHVGEELANEWKTGETKRIAEPERTANDAGGAWNENLRQNCAVQPLERIEGVAPGDFYDSPVFFAAVLLLMFAVMVNVIADENVRAYKRV